MQEEKPIENYIPREVLRFLSKGVEKATAHEKPIIEEIKTPRTTNHEAVVIFADVSGFTKLTETLSEAINNKNCFYGTDLLASNLNKYMSKIISVLTKNEADIIKFAGDSLIAIFPTDVATVAVKSKDDKENGSHPTRGSVFGLRAPKGSISEGDVHNRDNKNAYKSARAVRLAIDIQLGNFTKEFGILVPKPVEPSGMDDVKRADMAQLEKLVELKVKIGISRGKIVLAHIGGKSDKVMSRRVEYVAVGKALQEAFQCESYCEGGQICITADIKKDVYHLFKTPKTGKQGSIFLRQKKKVSISYFPVTDTKKKFYKVEGTKALHFPGNNMKFVLNSDFSNIIEPVLWSYVPLTAKPYLQTSDRRAEKWVNEFRKVTTIFCQLGFEQETTLGVAENDIEKLKRFDNIFGKVQECVYLYEGQINKFLIDDKGNTLIICFGLCPFAHRDDEARAVMCATSIIEVCEQEKIAKYIGISTGMVYCGLFGSSLRKEYTVLGDAVNIAARLMCQVIYDGIRTTGLSKELVKKHKKFELTLKSPGPLYIDQPTIMALTKTTIPIRFFERPEVVKLKGKDTKLRIFYQSQNESETFRAYSSVDKNQIFCENTGKTVDIKKMDNDCSIRDLKAEFKTKENQKLLWMRNPVTKLLLNVHDDELLKDLNESVNFPTILKFITVKKNDKIVVPTRRFLHEKYEFDLKPITTDQVAAENIVEIELADGSIILKKASQVKTKEEEKNIISNWYECLDSFSVIEKLHEFKSKLELGLQVVCLEGGFGVGKLFAINQVFNAKEKNKFHLIRATISHLSTLQENQQKVYTEMFYIIEQIIMLTEKEREVKFSSEERTRFITKAFEQGLKSYAPSERPGYKVSNDPRQPDERALWLLNQFLDTNFATENQTVITMEVKHNGGKTVVGSQRDMELMFYSDPLLKSVISDDPLLLNGLNMRSSVQKISPILCAILNGLSIEKPLVAIITQSQDMCPFSWVVLKQLCSSWPSTRATIIVPLKILSTVENLGCDETGYVPEMENSKYSSPDENRLPANKDVWTGTILKGIKESLTAEVENDEINKVAAKNKRQYRRSMRRLLSTNYQQHLGKAQTQYDTLPYPIAKKELHSHYLQIRLRSFTHSHFVEVRANIDYTAKIIKNILRSHKVDDSLVELLQERTNGNATYIKESLEYFEENGLLTFSKFSQTNELEVTFDVDAFDKNFKDDVPIGIESYCSMIFDQLTLFSQLILKVAAYLVWFERPIKTFKMFNVFLLVRRNVSTKKEDLVEAMIFLRYSNILDRVLNKDGEEVYKFAEDWMRICVLRKLTNEQRHAFNKELKVQKPKN